MPAILTKLHVVAMFPAGISKNEDKLVLRAQETAHAGAILHPDSHVDHLAEQRGRSS
ncbi:MAG: hypothetical protein ABI668_07485 [Sphingorhabdus sp.]